MAPPVPLTQLLAPVVAHVVHHDGDALTLSFAEIEDLIGAPVPLRAKVWPDAWQSLYLPTGHALKAAGGRATLDYRQRRVIFRRIAAAR
jgi:hypothetical protein